MNELEQRVQGVLDALNETFEVTVDATTGEDDDRVATRIILGEAKSDGSMLVERFCELFGPLIEQISEGRRGIVYEEGRGLTVRRVTDD